MNKTMAGESRFARLLSPITFGSYENPNRIIFGPHATGLEQDITAYGSYLAARARAGVSMIITSMISVHPSGQFDDTLLSLHDDADARRIEELVRVVKPHGAELFLQLGHMGRQAGAFSAEGTRRIHWAPSPGRVLLPACNVAAQQMNVGLIEEVVRAHGTAAARARDAGVTGVELYASHDGLLGSFLAERVNHRTDRYGGTMEARFRLLGETIAEMRSAVGSTFPLGVRISGDDCDNTGLSPEEALQACEMIDQLGTVDYLHISQGGEGTRRGMITAIASMTHPEGSGAAYARPIKARVKIPVIANGRINQPQSAEAILTRGDADAVCLVRPLICDADYVSKILRGAHEEIRACIACNQACIGHFVSGAPISCIQSPESGRETRFETRRPAGRAGRFLVVGGGPGGMKAALEAAARGHRVQLCEAAAQLGGQVLVAQLLPGREGFGGALTNLQAELARSPVDVRLHTRVDASYIKDFHPDCLVIATGGYPCKPEIDVDEDTQVVTAWSVIRGETNVGQRVVVVDEIGDWVAPGVAEILENMGCSVSIATIHPRLGEATSYGQDQAAGRMYELGIAITPYARLFGASGGTALFEHVIALRPIEFEGIDTLVISAGVSSERSLADHAAQFDMEVRVIGDCAAPRTAEEAIYEGFLAGRNELLRNGVS